MSFYDEEEALAHYGVKGMRWGVRKADGSASRPKKLKPTNQDIKDARRRVEGQQAVLRRLDDERAVATGAKQIAKMERQYLDKKLEFLKNPDRATALRMTSGEKMALAILGVTGYGAPTAAGYATGRVAARKFVERDVARRRDNA